MPGIEPWPTAFKASTFPAILSLHPLECSLRWRETVPTRRDKMLKCQTLLVTGEWKGQPLPRQWTRRHRAQCGCPSWRKGCMKMQERLQAGAQQNLPESGLVCPVLSWSGLAWPGLVWYGLFWPGLVCLVCSGLFWNGLVCSHLVWPGLAWLRELKASVGCSCRCLPSCKTHPSPFVPYSWSQ